MNSLQSKKINRLDYIAFDYSVKEFSLTVQLYNEQSIVSARTKYARIEEKNSSSSNSLLLYGEELELKRIEIDGVPVEPSLYTIDEKELCIKDVPDEFELNIETIIYPDKNSCLEGLYLSSGNYCTQCEAEGFRKITYFPDRPDVMTIFTTRMEADKKTCPVLLSNGNQVEAGDLDEGRHYVMWHDPHPKPSYLFAMVAGKLVAIEDEYVTSSGRVVMLKIFVEEINKHKCDHAMNSLKQAMRWDEEVFGLEYDLDIFMIVAVDDFNMGAMENKGLNIFNSKYVLSTPDTATDEDYINIQGVIGHEYFHNWTGNRVTCRDWFQLSLKEGLTVFRDQEFSSDMNSRVIQRIDDVRVLKIYQFKEDSSPLAHSVRPDSYIEINNFYTSTVYNKGAEVIRMMHTILGSLNFRKGMDLYFERHDGQAVTCDDFVSAMESGSGIDLAQFKRWYSQAGTPVLTVSTEYNDRENVFHLTVSQNCPQTPGQKVKEVFHIPIRIGLLNAKGQNILAKDSEHDTLLHLTEKEQRFSFIGIKEEPVVSFLRDFSAPVKVVPFQKNEDLGHLMEFDSNLYNRWDAADRLAGQILLEVANKVDYKEWIAGGNSNNDLESYINAIRSLINKGETSNSLLALVLQPPSEIVLSQEMEIINPDSLFLARKYLKQRIALSNYDVLLKIYDDLNDKSEYMITSEAMGHRRLKNTILSLLMSLDSLPTEILELCYHQYNHSTNMTDRLASLKLLVNIPGDMRNDCLQDFFVKYRKDTLVMDKWFSLQAQSSLRDCLNNVKKLINNPLFSISNPNKVRALVGAFCSGNHYRFHSSKGEGYLFLGDIIEELNSINPQIAARLVVPLTGWKRYDSSRQELMRKQLERLRVIPELSKDVYEIVTKSL